MEASVFLFIYLYKLNLRNRTNTASALWTVQRLCSCALLVAKEALKRSLPPAIRREDYSSSVLSAFACSGEAPLLKEISKDMEQNSEDSQGIRNTVGFQLCFERSAEIHSGEVKRARVSLAQAPRNAELFCVISFLRRLKYHHPSSFAI